MPHQIDASLLRIFLACVDAGSISGAARRLSRAQPTVTERLGRLEDIIGSQLLVRSARGVRLTQAGEQLLPYARRILLLSDEALRAVGRSSEPRDRVVLGMLEDLATGRFATLLRESDLIRGASLEFVSLPGASMRLALNAGRVDLAVGDAAELSLPAVRSWLEPLVWVAGPGVTGSERPLPVILCSPPCRFRERILQALDHSGENWRLVLESSTHTGLQAAVAGGLGVAAMLHRFLPDGVRRIAATAALPPLPTAEIALVRSPHTEPAALSDAVSDAVIAMMSA